jgi:hypothetical protein
MVPGRWCPCVDGARRPPTVDRRPSTCRLQATGVRRQASTPYLWARCAVLHDRGSGDYLGYRLDHIPFVGRPRWCYRPA